MAKTFYDPTVDVYNFRMQHSIGEFDPINCNSLLLRLNIITLYRPLSELFSGMCIRATNKNFILINITQNLGRQHFTIAHELYHLYVQTNFSPHICNPGAIKEVEERKADLFASALLMPESGIKSLIPENELRSGDISIPTLLFLEQFFSVSHIAMLIRLKEIGVINIDKKAYFESIKIKDIAKEYGFDGSIYKSGNKDVVLGDYGVKAKELFDNLIISESRYIELMNGIGINLTERKDE